MKKINFLLLYCFVLSYITGYPFSVSESKIPQLINFQGYLTSKDSKPVEDAIYEIKFSLKESNDENSSDIWSETHFITTKNGIYNVLLGSINSFSNPDNNDETNDGIGFSKQYYMSIKLRKGDQTWDTILFNGGLLPLTSVWSSLRGCTSAGRLIKQINENYTISNNDDILLVSTASTITICSAINNSGKIFTIKNLNPLNNQVFIKTISGQTIDNINYDPDNSGSLMLLDNKKPEITIISDGFNWQTIHNYSNFEIENYSITSEKIANNSITTEKLNNNSVTISKLNLNKGDISYTLLNLESLIKDSDISPDASISYTKLNLDGSYIADILSDNSITYSKLAKDSVNSDIILNNSIFSEDISPGAITIEKLNASGLPDEGQSLVSDGENGFLWKTINSGSSNQSNILSSLIVNGPSNLKTIIAESLQLTKSINAESAMITQLNISNTINTDSLVSKFISITSTSNTQSSITPLTIGNTQFVLKDKFKNNIIHFPDTSGTIFVSQSGKIGYSELDQNSVDSSKIIDNSINNIDICEDAEISYSKLNLINSINTNDILDSSVTYQKLKLAIREVEYTVLNLIESITNDDISNTGINYTKLNLQSMVNTNDIKDGEVNSQDIADQSIVPTKISGIFNNGNIGEALISDGGGSFYFDKPSPFKKEIEGVKYSKVFGMLGSGDGEFEKPSGIAVDSQGNIFVACRSNNRVQKFNNETQFLLSFGQEGTFDGRFKSPYDVEVDSSDNVYVADTNNHRIQKFNNNGTHLLTIGSKGSEDGQFNYPYGIAIDRFGYIYVADSSNHRIQKLSPDGTFIMSIGSNGSNDGELDFPYDVSINQSGNIYVLDRGNSRIQVFDRHGNFKFKFGSEGSSDGQISFPYGISLDAYSNVYVADSGNNRIQKFSITGDWIFTIGGTDSGFAEGMFNGPYNLCLDIDGNVYVSDSSNNRVQIFQSELPVYTIQTKGIGINTLNPDDSAVLDINSSTSGFLPPRMTQTQRTNIQNPAIGLIVFQTDQTTGIYYFDGAAWRRLADEPASP